MKRVWTESMIKTLRQLAGSGLVTQKEAAEKLGVTIPSAAKAAARYCGGWKKREILTDGRKHSHFRAARRNLAMTQKEAAGEIGCTTSTVYSWESGEHAPQPYWLKRAAEVYGVSEDYLLGKEG